MWYTMRICLFSVFLETNKVTYFLSLPKTNKATTGTELERVRDHSTDRSMRMMYYYGRSDSYLTFLGDEPNTDVVASRGHNLQRGARHTHLSNLVQGHATSFSIPLNSIVSNQRRHQK